MIVRIQCEACEGSGNMPGWNGEDVVEDMNTSIGCPNCDSSGRIEWEE